MAFLSTNGERNKRICSNKFPDLSKTQITNEIKRHNNRFTPKYREFSILQNKIEEVVNKYTRLWKVLYKKIDDFFDEEYKEEVAAKPKEAREERRKRVEEKKIEEKKNEEKEEEMNKGNEQE